jgi:hypothetical protein
MRHVAFGSPARVMVGAALALSRSDQVMSHTVSVHTSDAGPAGMAGGVRSKTIHLARIPLAVILTRTACDQLIRSPWPLAGIIQLELAPRSA